MFKNNANFPFVFKYQISSENHIEDRPFFKMKIFMKACDYKPCF